MLKITGPGGVDSTTRAAYVYVYSRLDNPTRLSGRRLSSTQVELTFNNYDSIPTSKTTAIAPWSDSLGLYFRKDSLPSNAQTGIALQTINITALQAAAKPFKDTVSVQASSPADSVFYGFSTALNWNDGIFALTAYLKTVPSRFLFVTDWGIIDSVRLLSRGRLSVFVGCDPVNKPVLTDADKQVVLGWLTVDSPVFVSHTPGNEFYPGSAAMLYKTAVELGYRREVIAVIRDSFEKPMYEVARFRQVGAGAGR